MIDPHSSEHSDATSTRAGASIAPEYSANSAQCATDAGVKKDPDASLAWERATLEKLAFAALTEKRTARRWRNFVRLAWLTFFILISWLVISRSGPAQNTSTPHTAVVEIKGEIASGAEASAELIVAALRSAFEDVGTRGVVLLINFPGGRPVDAGIINDEIRRLKNKRSEERRV